MSALKGAFDLIVADPGLSAYFGGRVAVDQFPAGATLPYLTGFEIDQIEALAGDQNTLAVGHDVQIDVWEAVGAERDTVVDEIRGLLAGTKIDQGRLGGGYRFRFLVAQRLLDGGGDGPADIVHKVVRFGITRVT